MTALDATRGAPRPAARRTTLVDTIRSEWIKARTVLVHWVLLLISIAFPAVVITLSAVFGDIDFVQSAEVADLIVGVSIVSVMLLGATAAISLTSEYTHNTIRPTYAATSSRLRVLVAKLIVNTLAIAFVTLLVTFGCWVIAELVFDARDQTISIRDDHVLAALVSVGVLGVLVSWFAFGLGLVIRNSPATVSVLLIWPLVVEGLIALVFFFVGWDDAGKYLPYRAALEATGTSSGSDSLGRPMGFVWFGGVSLVIVLAGVVLDHRRDA